MGKYRMCCTTETRTKFLRLYFSTAPARFTFILYLSHFYSLARCLCEWLCLVIVFTAMALMVTYGYFVLPR